jgi:hypothetical protein
MTKTKTKTTSMEGYTSTTTRRLRGWLYRDASTPCFALHHHHHLPPTMTSSSGRRTPTRSPPIPLPPPTTTSRHCYPTRSRRVRYRDCSYERRISRSPRIIPHHHHPRRPWWPDMRRTRTSVSSYDDVRCPRGTRVASCCPISIDYSRRVSSSKKKKKKTTTTTGDDVFVPGIIIVIIIVVVITRWCRPTAST